MPVNNPSVPLKKGFWKVFSVQFHKTGSCNVFCLRWLFITLTVIDPVTYTINCQLMNKWIRPTYQPGTGCTFLSRETITSLSASENENKKKMNSSWHTCFEHCVHFFPPVSIQLDHVLFSSGYSTFHSVSMI